MGSLRLFFFEVLSWECAVKICETRQDTLATAGVHSRGVCSQGQSGWMERGRGQKARSSSREGSAQTPALPARPPLGVTGLMASAEG